MKLLDLFAGIGGFSLAAHWAGWETVAFVEKDNYCQKVLKKNFQEIPIYSDIFDYEGSEHKADIITGGFPCTPFSNAGKRKGTDDDQYLWPEMLRIIQTVRPRWVVGENVAGLISMENGRTLERILIDLEDSGYNTETFLIPACSVGAWHRRNRIWIIAHLHGSKRGTDKRKPNTKTNRGDDIGGIHQNVSDATSKGLEREISKSKFSRRESGLPPKCDQWETEPSMGRVADGLPSWLAEPDGIPRITTETKDRVNKLKGLGNSIVPQVAYEIFKAINVYEISNQNRSLE